MWSSIYGVLGEVVYTSTLYVFAEIGAPPGVELGATATPGKGDQPDPGVRARV